MPKATFQKFIGFSLREKLSILFAQPIILFLIPRTYFRLYKDVLRGKHNDYETGFSAATAANLNYYNRIAEMVGKYSKKGYFSDTALGFSAKERFFLNPISLILFNRLKIRKFCIVTAVVLLFNILLIGAIEQNSWVFLLVFLIIPSSLFLMPFFRMAKPETFSWAFFPLAFYFFLNHYYFLSSLVVFLIAFLNFTTTLFTIASILVYSVLSINLLGVLVVLPGGLKILIDFIPFLTSPFVKGLLEVLGGKNPKTRKEKFLAIRPNDLLIAFFYTIFSLTFFSNISFTIFLLVFLGLFFANQTLFRFADNHTFFRLFFLVSTIFLIMEFNLASFIAYILLIYISSVGLFEAVEDIIRDYPHLKPYSIEKASLAAEEFFEKVEYQARIAFETDNTEKDLAGFREILSHFEYVLFKKEVCLLPGEYLRLTQMDYFMEEYIKINSKSSEQTIKEKLEELGTEYVLAHSEDFAEKLREWGYKELSKMSYNDSKENYKGLEVPQKNLYLFKTPFRAPFIVPETPLIRKPNLIKFKAEAGKKYTIKYNYHKAFKAYQNKKEIKVLKSEGKLSYISLTAPDTGEVELVFV